jgi:hypothetical protein
MPTTFNTTDPKPGYVYDSAVDTWFPLLGIAPGSSIVRWRFTAVGAETSVSGLDDLGATLSYNAGTEQVYLNGVLLVRTEDYLATTGTSVTGLTALAASDVIEVISFNATNVQITDALLETDINAKGDLIVGAAVDTATILASGTNGQVLKVNTATTSGLEWGSDSTYAQPTIGSTAITSGATVTTIAGLTLTSSTITTPILTLSSTSSTTSGIIAFDASADKVYVGDGTNAVEFASSTLLLNAQTGTTYTFAAADKDKLVTASTSAAQTYSIPTNATTAFPIGTQINVIQIGAGQVTIQAASSGTTTVSSTGATSTAPKLRVQYSSATLIKAGTDLWYVVGDIS